VKTERGISCLNVRFFSDIRNRFFSKTGAIFEYPSLLINASLVAKNVADAGKEIFERLVSMTVT
jgi:hypothetical protein